MATPLPPGGPTCLACGNAAVVNWRRRPTADELAEVVTAEEKRRAWIEFHADSQLPAPVFGALPTAADVTCTVYGCAQHAISLDAASLIHQGTCTAPDPDQLPGCNCTPEVPEPETPPVVVDPLPDHWVTGS
ncbi:hypothetical protein ACUXZZ_45530 (plasmid) [Streptomyces graminifolii]|uniref:hypothetical protein n=1 Tax=Streptomyces graminifolii TaxID=1266771 RepID=UPI0040597E1E